MKTPENNPKKSGDMKLGGATMRVMAGCMLALVTACAGGTSHTNSVTLGFLAFGDSGYLTDKPNGSGLTPVSIAMKEHCRTADCQFAVMLGDNIYPDGADGDPNSSADAERFEKVFIEPFGDLGGSNESFRIYTALGNHDWDTSRVGAFAQIAFHESTPPFYMDSPFYSIRPQSGNGEVEIFVIDTQMLLAAKKFTDAPANEDIGKSKHALPQTPEESDQLKWLEAALSASSAKWKFVTAHHPLWESNGGKAKQSKKLRAMLLPILCGKADAYFAGHQHTLEIHEDDCSTALGGGDVSPLAHIVSGAAAKSRSVKPKFVAVRDDAYPQLTSFFAVGDVWGFADVALKGDAMTVRMFAMPEKELDHSKMTEVFSHTFIDRVD